TDRARFQVPPSHAFFYRIGIPMWTESICRCDSSSSTSISPEPTIKESMAWWYLKSRAVGSATTILSCSRRQKIFISDSHVDNRRNKCSLFSANSFSKSACRIKAGTQSFGSDEKSSVNSGSGGSSDLAGISRQRTSLNHARQSDVAVRGFEPHDSSNTKSKIV